MKTVPRPKLNVQSFTPSPRELFNRPLSHIPFPHPHNTTQGHHQQLNSTSIDPEHETTLVDTHPKSTMSDQTSRTSNKTPNMSNGTINTPNQTTTTSNGPANTPQTVNNTVPSQDTTTNATASPHAQHAQHHAVLPSPPPTDDESSSSSSSSSSEDEEDSTTPPPMTLFQRLFSAARDIAIGRVESVQRGGVAGRGGGGQGNGGGQGRYRGGRRCGVILPGLRDGRKFGGAGGEGKGRGGRGGGKGV